MMTHRLYQKRLALVLECVRAGNLTSPVELAKQFQCTEKTIRNMINALRNDGHRIRYSRSLQKYLIDED